MLLSCLLFNPSSLHKCPSPSPRIEHYASCGQQASGGLASLADLHCGTLYLRKAPGLLFPAPVDGHSLRREKKI